MFDNNYISEEEKTYIKIGEDIVTEKLNAEANMRGVKRQRNVEHKNGNGKYPCENCDFQINYSGSLSKPIEAIHEGVCYSCNQCDYKATQLPLDNM